MGKGDLKGALKRSKAVEKAASEQKKKADKTKEDLESQGPVTITKDDLKDEETLATKPTVKPSKNGPKAKEQKKKDDYKSDVLSKKEQRKLKKAITKAQEKEESEDEESASEDGPESDDIEIAEEDDSEMEEYLLDLEKLARSDSESEDEEEEDEDEDENDDAEDAETKDNDAEEEDESEEEEEEDVPLSDVEYDSDADIVPHTKLTINNVGALKNALARIQIPWEKYTFQEHQSLTSKDTAETQIKDIYDDTERELAFYKQALGAALEGRTKLLKLKVPFTRPQDYFAEMVKSDEHMDKLKSKLIKEASEKKASIEAKRQRELKKFGKQVQNATLQERQKQKRETLDKIKGLKRKRQNDEISTNDFDVAIEEATADQEERRDRDRSKRNKPNSKRMAKDAKYGQGGMKRFKRKNDAESSADISGFSQRKMKGKAPRPGKSKRNRR